MYLNRVILIVTIICAPLVSRGQNIDKMFESATKTFYKEEFKKAIVELQAVVDLDPEYKDAAYKLEIASLLQKENREHSIDKMLAYKATKAQGDKFYYYWIGRIYANKYMFPEAVSAWKIFLKRKGSKSKEIVTETKDFIKETKLLVTYFDNPDNYEIHPLEAPINSSKAEMTPVYNKATDELIFASSVGSNKDVFQIFHSKRNNKIWSAPKVIKTLGTVDRQNASIEIVNEDGKLFIFNGSNRGSLFYSQSTNDGNWTVPVEFDSELTSTHLHSHFYINEHEDRIIFASNQKKKQGLDLYESFRDAASGKWSKPVPFASNIDTQWNEDSPFLSIDETKLYFSSDRQGGLGGYDVYMSELNPKTLKWGEPENLGWPINSPDDDFHFKLNEDGQSGYFISNRIHSMGDYDIFFFWAINKTIVRGQVINKLTKEPLTSGEIRFHPKSYLDEYFRSPIGKQGEYEVNVIANEEFKVEIFQNTDTLHVESFEVHEGKNEELTHIKDFYVFTKVASKEERLLVERNDETRKITTPTKNNEAPPTPESNQNTLLPNKKTTNKKSNIANNQSIETREAVKTKSSVVEDLSSNFEVGNKIIAQNIYFDFGTSQLKKESYETLDKIYGVLNGGSFNIEIGGHSDNLGNTTNNLKVSTNRAEAVKKWLVDKGISKDRIVARGYGSTQPIATNDDEEDGRELNRRIEIRRLNN